MHFVIDSKRLMPGSQSRVFICLLLFAISLAAQAQIVEIGNGNVLHQGLPIEPLARFSYTQQLFYSSQIALSGTITQISFKYQVQSTTFYAANKEWKIYLGHSSLGLMQDWVPISELSLVYDGILDPQYFAAGLPGSGWLTIPLQTPFYYNGSENLIIAVDENTDASSNSSDDFVCTQMASVRALNFQSLTINPDPADPPATFNSKTYLSNIRLQFGSLEDPATPRNLYAFYADGAVHLNWQAPQTGDPSSYIISRNSNDIYETTLLNHADPTIYPGTTYSYSVKAKYPGNVVSAPSNLVIIDIPNSGINTILFDSFETQPAFSYQIPGYYNLDLDQSPTWGWMDVDFPLEESPLAWMVFAPALTQPPLMGISAYSGGQMLASISAINPPNNDWLILPNLRPGTNSSLKFQARSLTAVYGLERLRVMISTGTADPASFSPLSGNDYLGIPAAWQPYEFDLGAYASQDVFLALNCVSVDAFALLIDDLQVSGEGGALDIFEQLPAIPIPFPNPARQGFSLKSESPMDVYVYNIRGQKLGGFTATREFSSHPLNLRPGIYLVKVCTPEASKTFRQVILP